MVIPMAIKPSPPGAVNPPRAHAAMPNKAMPIRTIPIRVIPARAVLLMATPNPIHGLILGVGLRMRRRVRPDQRVRVAASAPASPRAIVRPRRQVIVQHALGIVPPEIGPRHQANAQRGVVVPKASISLVVRMRTNLIWVGWVAGNLISTVNSTFSVII